MKPFKRKIYKKLLDWKVKSNGDTALLIEGARRIGKSTIVEEFGKNEYESYLLVDFTIASATVKEAFLSHLNDLDTFWMLLSSVYHKTLHRRKSLVIFDEIQKFPKAREAVKYLVKDGRYDIIETGSLISIKENVKDINLPSEEHSVKMFPMDFEEFCLALDEAPLLDYSKKCFDSKIPLENNLHKKASLLFRQYMLVGGMPKAVAQFIQHDRNFSAADVEKRKILETYRNDIAKIDRNYRSKVQSIFDQIPSFLSQHEKRVRLRGVEGSVGKSYEDTFFWLADSMIANECFNTTDPNIGLSLNEKRTYIKCYMGDTGLLISHTFDENQLADEDLYLKILQGKLSLNEGMFFENVVAQMLSSNGHKLYYYNHYSSEKKRNDIEIDFLIGTGNKLRRRIIPIEVKSSRNYTITSLQKFIEKFSERIDHGIVVHPGNLKIQNGITYIPAYMAIYL